MSIDYRSGHVSWYNNILQISETARVLVAPAAASDQRKGVLSMAADSIPQCPGIYIIRNSANDYFYVGSSVNLRNRWQHHQSCLRRNTHHNRRLQSAWNKYGAGAFSFSVIEIVPHRAVIAEAEQRWLDAIGVASRRDAYNFCPVAYSSAGAKRSLESRRRISESQRKRVYTPEMKAACAANLRKATIARKGTKLTKTHRERIAKAHRGKVVSAETRQKLREMMLQNPRGGFPWGGDVPMPDSVKEKIRKAHTGRTGDKHPRSLRIEQLSIEGDPIGVFVGISEAARSTGIARKSICNCLHKRSGTAGGYKWRYA